VAQQERWQLSGNEPESYELYQVPRLLGPMAHRLLEGVALRPGQRVLDVACGTGIVARLAAPRVAPSGRIVGVDLNAGMLAMARDRASESGLQIDFRQGDAAALPFAAAEFDAVFCQQGLQFFPDKPRALCEMHRVIRPGGVLALSVFAPPSRFSTALAEALTRHAGAEVAKRSLAPFALADAEALRALMNAVSFSSIEIRNVVLTRRVEPTQEWLLQYTSAMPYGAAVTGMDPIVRAEMVREIAGQLRDLWDVDSFAIPTEVRMVYARK
jgi:ubiquinone/menaquinone biosynthesis C-methylase UbiE